MCGADEQFNPGSGGDVVGRTPQHVPLWMAAGAKFPLRRAVLARALEWPCRQTLEEQPRR